MKRLAAAVLFFGLAAPLFAGDAAPAPDSSDESTPAADSSDAPEREARLTSVEGTVYVRLHDGDADDFNEAEKDAPVESGDLVRTGSDGRAELTIDGQTVIDLAPNTDFVVNSLAPEETEFHLGIGSITAKIKKLLEGQKMSFHTATAVAAVRGTELGVSQAGDDSPAQVGVFDEGHVAVTTAGGAGEVHLGPRQETECAKGGKLAEPRALKFFTPARDRMVRLRERQEFFRKSWRPQTMKQRMARRVEMRRRPAFNAAKLRNVREDIRQRQYQQLPARQQALRQERQQLRRERIERRQRRLQQRKAREQGRTQQKASQPDQGRQNQMRQKRAAQASHPQTQAAQRPPQDAQKEQAHRQEEQREAQIRERRKQEALQHREEQRRRNEEQQRLKKEEKARWKAEREKDRAERAQRDREREERFKQAQQRRQEKVEQLRQENQQREQQKQPQAQPQNSRQNRPNKLRKRQ